MPEHSPLTPAEIDRLRTKQPAPGYRPLENRLVIAQESWDRMVAANHIVIPDDPRYHIAHHSKRQTPEEGASVDPIYTIDNPMSSEQVQQWHSLGLLTDTAGRPLHRRAAELFPTIGMFTGPGRYYWYGPQPIGNLALRRVRGDVVEYAVTLVKRPEPTWGLPGGFAKHQDGVFEPTVEAAFRETAEETGVNLRTEEQRRALGGFVIREALSRIKLAPSDTAHAWMEEWFTHAYSEANRALEGIELQVTGDPHILEVRWMDKHTIYQTKNFLGPHKRMVRQLEGDAA